MGSILMAILSLIISAAGSIFTILYLKRSYDQSKAIADVTAVKAECRNVFLCRPHDPVDAARKALEKFPGKERVIIEVYAELHSAGVESKTPRELVCRLYQLDKSSNWTLP